MGIKFIPFIPVRFSFESNLAGLLLLYNYEKSPSGTFSVQSFSQSAILRVSEDILPHNGLYLCADCIIGTMDVCLNDSV